MKPHARLAADGHGGPDSQELMALCRRTPCSADVRPLHVGRLDGECAGLYRE